MLRRQPHLDNQRQRGEIVNGMEGHCAEKTSRKAQRDGSLRALRNFTRPQFCTDRSTIVSAWWGSVPKLQGRRHFRTKGCCYCGGPTQNNFTHNMHR
jgi:hypothetical protein